jgi:hypothetical protein
VWHEAIIVLEKAVISTEPNKPWENVNTIQETASMEKWECEAKYPLKLLLDLVDNRVSVIVHLIKNLHCNELRISQP